MWSKLKQYPGSPGFLLMDFIVRCNQKCLHCDNWKFEEVPSAYMTEQNRFRAIEEAASLGCKAFIPCGGEAFIERESLFKLASVAKDNGMKVLLVSNGTLIRNFAEAVSALTYIDELSISFDDVIEEEHSLQRGLPAAGLPLRACRLLVDARKLLDDRKVNMMLLVTSKNFERIPQAYELARELQLDKVKLNFAQPRFGGDGHDEWFESHALTEWEPLHDVLKSCESRFSVKYSKQWLDDVKSYVDGMKACSGSLSSGWDARPPLSSTGVICNSADRNIMLDRFGRMRLCWGKLGFPRSTYSKQGDMTEFWQTTSRTKFHRCKRACGISHSVRRSKCYEV